MTLLVATWTGALATVGLLVGAGITAWYARKAFREQSREVALLQEQVKDDQRDRAREAADRRRAQAARVFIWVTEAEDTFKTVIHVRNTSEQPVHDLSIGRPTGPAIPVTESEGGPLMPGEENIFDTPDLPGADAPVWLDFRDAAGLRWRATSRSELTELPDQQQASL